MKRKERILSELLLTFFLLLGWGQDWVKLRHLWCLLLTLYNMKIARSWPQDCWGNFEVKFAFSLILRLYLHFHNIDAYILRLCLWSRLQGVFCRPRKFGKQNTKTVLIYLVKQQRYEKNNKNILLVKLHSNDVRFFVFFVFRMHINWKLPKKKISLAFLNRRWASVSCASHRLGPKIDSKIIRIRNIIILQFVEHKHDVWWTVPQFRPTFLLVYVAKAAEEKQNEKIPETECGEVEKSNFCNNKTLPLPRSEWKQAIFLTRWNHCGNMKNMISK